MSTGGIALLLGATPNRFDGLTTIGKVVYIFDLVIFVGIVAAITIRFTMTPGSFFKAISHPTEMLFIPTAFIALVSVFSGAQIYGVPSSGTWLIVALRVLFWMYVAAAFLLCVALTWQLIHSPATRLTLATMTPVGPAPLSMRKLSLTGASRLGIYQRFPLCCPEPWHHLSQLLSHLSIA
jgi:tellurite resistance protein TehA-like permease